ncbi:Putative GABA permease [Aspergillus calidoustus]|uniref:Putative GABA permease n=1 Tax=Aspergillus calidoustus TaxID=454130 RepID=A0A0U5GG79_ASPCI|nr:Putative GABA permease [Aspergillus calidoustus]
MDVPAARNPPSEEDAFAPGVNEDIALENLGYRQELQRTFSLLDMIGFSFSIVTCWTALSGGFIIGVTAGGPPVMIFGWIGVCVLTLTVAFSMAEMCSRWPVAGGQYSWVALLAPPKVSRELSYITGWFMLTGLLAMGAVNNSFAANFLLGQANLVFPSFTIERWHTVLVTYAVVAWSLTINVFAPHLLNRLSRGILIWNICSFMIITVTLLATNSNKQAPSFVFQDFQNFTGFGQAMATIIGILQSFFGMCCYDAPSHMTEEMKHPSRDAPIAMVLSVGMGSVTGFVFLLTLCFCIGDIDNTAASSTGVPVIQIFYDSTNSKVGACFMASMITVINLVCAVSLLAEGSRSLFAFARDNGLPFSKVLSKVTSKSHIPLNAIFATVLVQMAFNSIYFGTITGFNTILSIATTGFYISYAFPLLSRLLGYITNHRTTAFTGSFALALPLSLALNALGLLFLLFAFVTFNFPSLAPVDDENMNYTSAAIGVIALVGIGTWVVSARKRFTGPVDMVHGVGRSTEGEPSAYGDGAAVGCDGKPQG